MKKSIMLCFALIFVFSIGTAAAWDYCFQDFNYTPELWFSFNGSVIYGQATLEGSPYFPSAITGKVYGGYAYFSIDYLDNSGLRFYWINARTGEGQTWGVYTDTGQFYDYPHSAGLSPCGKLMDDVGLGTGAAPVE